MKKIIVTGSSGLIGSEAVIYFEKKGYRIIAIDNNMRAVFFGAEGDTLWNLRRLRSIARNFEHYDLDIRNRDSIMRLVREAKPAAIIHCAAQPSHDLAATRPFDDFEVNATGTLNLLEAARHYCPESPFVFMSTNKVYGDAPNEIELAEKPTRWDYADPKYFDGIDEDFRIDQSKHSLFGASKLAADIMTQEYGRYFGIPTVCFRGGCLTGPNHSGVGLHGFLSYLVKVALRGDVYKILGYKGKQVRDQIHSYDVVKAFEAFISNPRTGAVYNLGGGRENSASILECISLITELTGVKVRYEYIDQNRIGDHICYISNLKRFRTHYPDWSITRSLKSIVVEMIDDEKSIKVAVNDLAFKA